MARLVKCLPCKQEDMSVISRTHEWEPGKSGIRMHACNPGTGEVETGRSQGFPGQVL